MRHPIDPSPSGSAPRAALAAVRQRARARAIEDRHRIARVVGPDAPAIIERLRRALRGAPLTINFHPDRVLADGQTVVGALRRDGVYRCQFETGISNGGLTAFAGGDRDRWEARLFDGAYQQPEAHPANRPKYGGLNLLRHPDGACPRFGSCHLRLRPSAWAMATVTYGDSVLDPDDRGAAGALDGIIAALVEAADAGVVVLGRRFAGVAALLDAVEAATPSVNGRALDHYIEVQFHGPLRLSAHVEAVIIDPSFDNTAVGAELAQLAAELNAPLERHAGFGLRADAVPPEMRGPQIAHLAQRIAAGGWLDAAVVGAAAASVVRAPQAWADWASPAETLQHLKYLWHVLVVHGRPARGA